MIKAFVHASRLEDAIRLAPNLREQDVAEVRASSGQSPLEALFYGVEHSIKCYTIADADGPVAMFGVAAGDSQDSDLGLVWMLASPRLLNHRRQLIQESRYWLSVLLSVRPRLWNVVDESNKVHLRFLQWLGASFHTSLKLGGRRFTPFTLCVPQQ